MYEVLSLRIILSHGLDALENMQSLNGLSSDNYMQVYYVHTLLKSQANFHPQGRDCNSVAYNKSVAALYSYIYVQMKKPCKL